jgi:hypothetical protein
MGVNYNWISDSHPSATLLRIGTGVNYNWIFDSLATATLLKIGRWIPEVDRFWPGQFEVILNTKWFIWMRFGILHLFKHIGLCGKHAQ